MDIHSKKASSTLRTLRQSDVYVCICIYIYKYPSIIHGRFTSLQVKRGNGGRPVMQSTVEKAFSRNRLRLRSSPFGLIRPGSVDFKNVRSCEQRRGKRVITFSFFFFSHSNVKKRKGNNVSYGKFLFLLLVRLTIFPRIGENGSIAVENDINGHRDGW